MRSFFFAILITLTASATIKADNTTLTERLRNPVYVVLSDDNTEFNTAVKSAVENFWTVSDYAFVSREEYKALKKSDVYIFLMLLDDESIDGSSNAYEHVLQLFYMVHSGSYRNNITGAPVANLTKENAALEITNAVRLVQDKLSFKIAGEASTSEYANFEDAVKSRTGIVKTKKLYIAQEDLDKDLANLEDIKNVYSGEVIIVSKAELAKMVNEKNDILYVSVGSYKNGMGYMNLKQVLNADSGTVLYNNETKSVKPVAFNKSDFEKLSK